MINVYSLGSGSKGNCMVISDGKSCVMIDAGLSEKTIMKKLVEIGLRKEDINGILVTHEHNDHVRSLSELSYYIPFYSHYETVEALKSTLYSVKNSNEIEEKSFEINGFNIKPFAVSHDAVRPLGYVIDNGNEKVAYLTDTGYISQGILNKIKGCDSVIIESNHDKELLIRGAYPERLKRRILSDKGHLCNEETALCVNDLIKSGTQKILLSHISENNNLAELAYWTTVKYLMNNGCDMKKIKVKVAPQRETVIL